MGFDINRVRADFPILDRQVYNKPLVYLDNGATTQKPAVVIRTIREIQEQYNSSIHRGIHYLSEQMTSRYEAARERVREFLNASSTREVIFTSGATGSINAIAFSFGEQFVGQGDEVLISEMEHHSNLVPWQMLCERKKATLRVIPFLDNGELDLDSLNRLLGRRTKIVALAHASNSLGTINPVKEVIERAHEKGIPVLLDGAQMVQHGQVDVRDLDCDFYVFSSHKIFGKASWLERLPPYQGGGDMVDRVTLEGTTYNELPFKFEAGTTNYSGAIGLAAALDYIKEIGVEEIARYERELIGYTMERLMSVPGLTLYGKTRDRISVFSFLLQGIHAYDTGMILDKMGIAVRTGNHCAQPVMDHFGISGTIRASLVFYNTREEVDTLVTGIGKAVQMLS
jgi:cysteine desulfurase/selenocysteine lyase